MKTFYKYTLSFTLSIVSIATSFSNAYAFGSTKSNIQEFINIDTKFNYLLSDVFFVSQDSLGYIWFCTGSGLCRFNGTKIEQLTSNYKVSSILEDNTSIWLATYRGLQRLDKRTHQISQIKGTKHLKVQRVLKRDNDKLWFTTNRGVFLYDILQDSLTLFDPEKIVKQDDYRQTNYRMYGHFMPDGELLVGTYGYCLAWNEPKKMFDYFKLPSLDDTKENFLSSILEHRSNPDLLYLGTEHGLILYNRKTTSYKLILKVSRVDALQYDKNGNIWAGTSDGLYTFSPTHNILAHYSHASNNPRSIANNLIHNIFFDKEGNIWLSTENGVSMAPMNQPFRQYNLYDITNNSKGNKLNAISSDGDHLFMSGINGIIIYNWRNGSNLWLSTQAQERHRLLNDMVMNAVKDKTHDLLWIATSQGLHSYDFKKDKVRNYNLVTHNSLYNSNWIYQISDDGRGNLYLSTYESGIFVVDKEKLLSSRPGSRVMADKHYNNVDLVPWKLKYTYLPLLCFADSGSLWVYDYRNGIERIPLNKNTSYHNFDVALANLSSNIVLDMAYFGGEYIWVVMNNGVGKIKLSNNSFEKIDIVGINEDLQFVSFVNENSAWAVDKHNIQLIDFVEKKVKNRISASGISDIFYEATTQRLYFSVNDNFGYIETNKIPTTTSKNNTTIITGINIAGEEVEIGKLYDDNVILPYAVEYCSKIELLPTQNTFSIEFSNLEYSNIRPQTYKYRLKGFSNEWEINTNPNKRVSFIKIPPGKYTFEVVLVNESNNTISNTAFIEIIILAPWYKSKIAFILYAVVLILVMFILWNWFMKRNKRKIENVKREKSIYFSKMKIAFLIDVVKKTEAPINTIITHGENDEILTKSAKALKKTFSQFIGALNVNDKNLNIDLFVSPVEVVGYCYDIVDNFRNIAYDRMVDISFNSNINKLTTLVDADKLRIVIMNILSFVMNSTAKSEEVNLLVQENKETEMVEIIISSHSLLHNNSIFKLLLLAKKSRKKGLRIAQEIVMQNAGSVSDRCTPKSMVYVLSIPKWDGIDMNEALETGKYFGNHDAKLPETQDTKFIHMIDTIIENNIQNLDLNLSILSNESGYSNKKIYHKLKSITGLTPNEYIRNCRLHRAAFLLSNEGFSVSEVLYMVGFSNHSYFTKCFKNEFHITPKEFSKQKKLDRQD